MAHVIRAELDFVAIFGEAWREEHDSGIVYENVETIGGCGEGLDGFGNGRERSEIELEAGNVGVGYGLFNGGDRGFAFGRGSSGEEETRIVCAESSNAC